MSEMVFINPVHIVGGTTDICYTKDGTHFISCGQDGNIHIFEAKGNPVRDIRCADLCNCIVQHGNRLYIGTNKNELEVRSFPEGYVYPALIQFDEPVSSLFLSNSLLFVGTRNFKVVMVNLNDYQNDMKYFDGHEGFIIDLNAHSEKQLLATASADGCIRIFNINGQKLIRRLNIIKHLKNIETSVLSIKIDWDRFHDTLAVPIDNSIYFYGSDNWSQQYKYINTSIKEVINTIRYSPCKLYFIISYVNGELHLINRITHHIHKSYSTSNVICSIVWNPFEISNLILTTNNGQYAHIDISKTVPDYTKLRSLQSIIDLNKDSIKKKSDNIVVFLIHLLANHNIFYKEIEITQKICDYLAPDFVGYIFTYIFRSNQIILKMLDNKDKFMLYINVNTQEIPTTVIVIDDYVKEEPEGTFSYNNLLALNRICMNKFKKMFQLLQHETTNNNTSTTVIDQTTTNNNYRENSPLLKMNDDLSDGEQS